MKWKPLKRFWFSVVCSVYHQLKLVVNEKCHWIDFKFIVNENHRINHRLQPVG